VLPSSGAYTQLIRHCIAVWAGRNFWKGNHCIIDLQLFFYKDLDSMESPKQFEQIYPRKQFVMKENKLFF